MLRANLASVAVEAHQLEAAGYDGIWSVEAEHDPFLPLVLAAEHTRSIQLGTAIAVALPRSPMHLANLGHDLQCLSQGRFILGLGSQVRTHIEKRFSGTWGQPAARMRELIDAIRAIWACWNDGIRLDFRGKFYTHTLMTPFFHPGPNLYGAPRIFLASVGAKMTEVAGDVADGLITHPFTTPRYLRECTLPALERGLKRSGRQRGEVEISCSIFVVTGVDSEKMEKARESVRQRLAFYGSTPEYRSVLETHGWGDLQTDLSEMSKRGLWFEMAELIDDKILGEFAVVTKPEDVAAAVRERYAGLVDRVNFYAPYPTDLADWNPIRKELENTI